MKLFFYASAFLLLTSCGSRTKEITAKVKSNNGQVFSYRDISGEYELTREVKVAKKKLATRNSILSLGDVGERQLEKTFAVSDIGSVSTRRGREIAIRPSLSQHTVWLEGKRYFTQLKLNTKTKSLEAIMDSPDPNKQGKRSIRVPKGQVFCFYSQLPECLIASGLISQAKTSNRRPRFYIVWDSWPYHQEHFTGLKNSPFAAATIGIEGKNSFVVEFSGQIISLHFSNDMTFARLLWTSQGISILPPGEMQDNQEL
jgi:hypothetical protein